MHIYLKCFWIWSFLIESLKTLINCQLHKHFDGRKVSKEYTALQGEREAYLYTRRIIVNHVENVDQAK